MGNVVIITGSAGLIGSEAVKFFAENGYDVVGIDNDMRSHFFGKEASTAWNRELLCQSLKNYTHHEADIRDENAINSIYEHYKGNIALTIHTAAQPSHDWAAQSPVTDFTVNANGTLVMLEAARKFAIDAPFIFTSTNKVYGDLPNSLPLIEKETRWEIDPSHAYYKHGIDEAMSIDQSTHSVFGASKVAADVMVQEYGRYFGMNTACFRGGCLTGPAHSGAKLHGFLAYLMKCTASGDPYTVLGYKGKQVRDNIHSHDLVSAFWHFAQKPRSAQVYNIGGGRRSNCSMLEAITECEIISGRELEWTYEETNRTGDHIWWISDIRSFSEHYPEWKPKFGITEILTGIYEANQQRWLKTG